MALWQLRINWAININRWTIVTYVTSWKTRQVTIAREASWKIQAAAQRPQKFHGNPNAKTARFSEIQRITAMLVSVLRDTLSELFPYKSEAL